MALAFLPLFPGCEGRIIGWWLWRNPPPLTPHSKLACRATLRQPYAAHLELITCMTEWTHWKPTHYYLLNIELSIQISKCLYLFSLSVWLSDSGLARNKREPQEIQNPGYQLHRYEKCLMQAWLYMQAC